MIYLDNAATTFPKPECVYVAMDKINREGAVNAGRGSYKLAQKASDLIADTKKKIRELVHVDSSTAVVFSPSITIAINQIVNGLNLRNNSVVYVSPYEHNAVARSLHRLSKKLDIVIEELPLNEKWEIDIEKMKYLFSKNKPDVVFCTHISNVTGYVLPIKEIFSEAKRHGSINILDSAQSMGLVDIRADLLDVDLIGFAGHKTLYGPLGIGGFINVSGVKLDTFIAGGTGSDSLNLEMPINKESKYESASTNIVAIAGLYAALSVLDIEKNFKYEKKITEHLIKRLSSMDEVKMFLPSNLKNHVGIVSFVFDGMNSDDLGMILDEDYDIAVRTGYHCAPYIHKYLHDESTLGTVRIGVSQFTTEDDVDQLIEALEELKE
ncbi:MAG: aminotransferase class V-fold PLP-dependent enzyme [Holdemanella porci]|nr:aminotransferase class V-fold PLP-dependent enzyme [Holdemanella porci]